MSPSCLTFATKLQLLASEAQLHRRRVAELLFHPSVDAAFVRQPDYHDCFRDEAAGVGPSHRRTLSSQRGFTSRDGSRSAAHESWFSCVAEAWTEAAGPQSRENPAHAR